ncbi:MAG: hypothetical protein M3Z33_12490 [Actinomycetota bacterium]|nr:hypothetical protein [Actinomycetota bacterium]
MPGPAEELCPGCGSPLEPVHELAEIVGYRSISPRADAAGGRPSTGHKRRNRRTTDVLDLEQAIRAQVQLDSAQSSTSWGLSQATVALVPPETNS